MKKLLLIFLLLPFCSHAQLEPGVNYGITPFNLPGAGPGLTTRKSGSIYDLTLCYKIRKIRVGMGYSSSTISYASPGTPGTFYYAKPMTDVYLFADREWHFFEAAFLYLGINIGSVSITDPGTSRYPESISSAKSYGMHLGYSRKLVAGLYANAQAEFTAIRSTFKGFGSLNSAPASFTAFPLTLGLHYKFDLRKKKKPEAAAPVK